MTRGIVAALCLASALQACAQVAALPESCMPRAGAAGELLRAAPASPLYRHLAAGHPLQQCRVEPAEGSAVRVTLDFGPAGQLQISQDPRIEMTEQSARFGGTPPVDARDLLARTVDEAYGPTGCGIDWNEPEERAGKGGTETVYRGEVCNCQAVIRRDAGGAVTALVVRSAC